MEIRDLLDKNRKYTGETIAKGQEIPKDKYIMVVIIIIQNSEGKYLVQKRSKGKDGKWGSTGGHLCTGENSLDGILREVQEEIGIKLQEDDIEFVVSKKLDDVFVDIYYSKLDYDISKLILQKEEVEKVEWMTIDEIEKLYNNGEFLPSHRRCFKNCIECLENETEE